MFTPQYLKNTETRKPLPQTRWDFLDPLPRTRWLSWIHYPGLDGLWPAALDEMDFFDPLPWTRWSSLTNFDDWLGQGHPTFLMNYLILIAVNCISTCNYNNKTTACLCKNIIKISLYTLKYLLINMIKLSGCLFMHYVVCMEKKWNEERFIS